VEDLDQFSWKFFFFLHNFSQPSYGFFWESWSLSIEEWFYLSTPLALALILTKVKPRKAFLLVIGLMIAVSITYRLLHLGKEVDFFWYQTIFKKIVLMRLDSIAFGLLAAWVYHYHEDLWLRYRKYAFAAGLVFVWLTVSDSTPVNTFYKKVVYMTFSSFAIMLLIPVVESWKSAKGIASRAVTHISKISYSMYLINLALVAEVIRDNFPPQGGSDGLLKYAIFWAVTVGVSTLLYKYFEKPVMNLRDRFSN
jgi:peptidoglycan/LPS O-acetylase OafA/YrhL